MPGVPLGQSSSGSKTGPTVKYAIADPGASAADAHTERIRVFAGRLLLPFGLPVGMQFQFDQR